MEVDRDLLDMMLEVDVSEKRTLQVVETPAGSFHVSIAGNRNRNAIITLHEIGLNSDTTFDDLFYHPSAKTLRSRWCLYNINVPGQHAGCEESIEYPRIEVIIESLGVVLNQLGILRCVALGYGAGAYMMSAFANKHPGTVRALILINAVIGGSSCRDYSVFNSTSVVLENHGLIPTVRELLFGYYGGDSRFATRRELIAAFDAKFDQQNPVNLASFMGVYARRETLQLNMQIPVLSIYGSLSPEVTRYRLIFQGLANVKIFEIPGCTFPLAETPETVGSKGSFTDGRAPVTELIL